MAVSLKPYIGTRDFYPVDMQFRNWMFAIQRQVCEKYAYQNYDTPTLELLDLYRTKTSEEIVNEQVYSFTDRGDRQVAIRPELTPSLARIFAARHQDFALPARLYNIGRFMRYERPGRGRLREFWQLNVDLLGAPGALAEIEICQLAIEILRSYGAKAEHFQLRYSDRRLMESVLAAPDPSVLQQLSRLIDKKDKIKSEEFDQQLADITDGDKNLIKRVYELLNLKIASLAHLNSEGRINDEVCQQLSDFASVMEASGYKSEICFDPSIARGFNYYTGFVFEIIDLDPENRRALFGGGRYDKLIGMLGKQNVAAIGFGMGDVTLENFIRSHKLPVPDPEQRLGIYIALLDQKYAPIALEIARTLRHAGQIVEQGLQPEIKPGKQFQLADRKKRRFVFVLGESEIQQNTISVKDLESGQQIQIGQSELPDWLQSIKA
ncbi:MAG: histidine--tRNA ligase [Leptospiraceae bacterium]|nr:histidine--tRNA ligase [Leptospiraceae bacterium]